MPANQTIEKPAHEKLVRIHIDQKPHESPSPTTGMALYRLGHVPSGLELYREVSGDHEDALVVDGPETVHLKTDEHFHSGAPSAITIIVDGTRDKWDKPEISYAEVVTLADPDYPKHPELTYSVKYKHGPGPKPEGILAPGASVKVKNKMVFNVSKTGQS
jgi:hypothetical protein